MKTFSSRFLRHIIASGALIILSSSLLACSSDPTAPTDENFAAAILAAQKAEALCLDQNPLQDSRGGFSDKAVLVQSPSRWAAWEDLVRAGMYTKEEVRENATLRTADGRSITIPAKSFRYTLSDAFQKLLNKAHEICIAQKSFGGIVSHDGPRLGFGGVSVVRVQYKEALGDFVFQIENQKSTFEKYFPEIKAQHSSEQRTELVLTKLGWRTVDSIKDPRELIQMGSLPK